MFSNKSRDPQPGTHTSMKAMILAAGLGTRLRPLTDTMPKALVPLAGRPLLWHAVQKLKTAGFDEIIINVHHFAEQIIDYVHANARFGIRIEFSDEREQLLDTGGGLKKAAGFFDDEKPFLIYNVDILSDLNLTKLFETHIGNNSSATLVVSKRDTSRHFLFDESNCLTGWINEKTGEVKSPVNNLDPARYRKLAFSGIHVLQPSVFKYMDTFPVKFSLVDFYLSICGKEKIAGYVPETISVLDVGKPDSLKEAERLAQKGFRLY